MKHGKAQCISPPSHLGHVTSAVVIFAIFPVIIFLGTIFLGTREVL